MQIKKNDLLGVLNRLSPFFVEKSISPILECLHFDDSGIQVYTGEIYATSTDSTLQGLVGSVKSNLFLKIIVLEYSLKKFNSQLFLNFAVF